MTPSALALTPRQRERLDSEDVVWLTTINASQTLVPTPVWFLWSGEQFLIFSEPRTPKLANIARGGVTVNFNCTSGGGDVAVLTGDADEDPTGPTGAEWDAYVSKYREAMSGMDYTPEKFRAKYSTLIRVTPQRVRGW
ncbi:TIGR03667 family PPOX class F420-dependent oxidoreductase [Williamsia sp. 1135]|uniref:TIGR03667 family PPOX class F420-dependent oxidoreductase n=1 Tax=Williamsia sp. 1135 TaxID=1889262 RepID=UPI000A11B4C6|nr:TIGR03667 family PPOX class F420-dependent oxidoreductase [Williamsia sp. 1135]ORM26088.1 PPOX class F420-dependent oxidoreductase [Williamsia sp. 1135]